jgi:hypothetical protein
MANAWECFHSATLELVRSSPIKQRLVGAYQRHLVEIKEEQLPRELRETFSQVMRSLRGVRPQPGEDEVTASVRKMSSVEADECATLIVEMFGLISGFSQASNRPVASVVALHPEVPAMIAAVSRA